MNRVCFALDFPMWAEALDFIDFRGIHTELGAVKVGLELFISSAKTKIKGIRELRDRGLPVVLDLKLHDIPETVERAVKAGGDLGVHFMTLHVQQRSALERAVKAAEPYGIQLLGVTVLTSMTEGDCIDLGHQVPSNGISQRVQELVTHGKECGLTGFVCSPKEIIAAKEIAPNAFYLVPGVRPAGADNADQQRVGTPQQAVAEGASLVVIGRPIRDAADPLASLQRINASIGG